MADEELQVVQLHDDFYKDSFSTVVLIILSICVAIAILLGISLYLYWDEPKPITFPVENDWRILKSVPLDQPYLSTPDLLQWTSDSLQKVFVFDFNHYNDQLSAATPYFTPDGWNVFLNQLNNYVNYNQVLTKKMFVNCVPTGAPFIVNQGLLSGRYAWWVQMPINLSTISGDRSSTQALTLQVLVVRVPTLNNLNGVGIDNIIVLKNQNGLPIGSG